MADIAFNRTFIHQDWIDNEDVVQAETENGFNVRFHGLEADLDKVAQTFSIVDQEIKARAQVRHVATISKQLAPDQVTEPEEFDTYETLPGEARKLYHVATEPFGASHGQVSHHFVYQPSGPATKVSIWFRNERNVLARVTVRVFSVV